MSASLRLAAGIDPAAHARAWLAAPELAALVAAFGGQPPTPGESIGVALERLDAFSDRWNYRGGKERNETAGFTFTDRQRAAIADAAEALGQLDLAAPQRREWDVILVLGGLLRACISRPMVTAALIDSGEVNAREIVGVGALRPLNDGERTLATAIDDIIPADAVPLDELDAMTFGFRHAFDLAGVFNETGECHRSLARSWRQRTYGDSKGPAYRVIAAAAPQAGRRATTPETLAWFAAREGLEPGTSVLLVTTEIYRHYHLIDAVRTLGIRYGAVVDCVGMSPADADPRLALDFSPASRVQEIRSSIRALRALVSELA